MSAEKTPVQIFVAYSQKDRVFLDGLRAHIKPLERNGQVKIWYDGEIQPGEAWDDAIKSRLKSADIVLALLSSNALASDYFYDEEITHALERHNTQSIRVVPILLSPCLWQQTPLAGLQGLPTGMKPVSAWKTFDDAWHNVMLGLMAIIGEMKGASVAEAAPTAKASTADSDVWEITTEMNTPAAYQKYLDRFPQGFYAENARQFLEDVQADDTYWEFANDAGTDQAIFKYLQKYPKGLHSAEARRRIDPFHELMVFVKGGTFEMGDVFGEGSDHEKPVHLVTLDDFWMCKYPVTQGLWKAVMGADNNPSHFTGQEDLPVDSVSWEMAQAFIETLNKKSGQTYRLPTEAEWEYAAREGGKKVRFGNGKDSADPAEINFNASKEYKQSYSIEGAYRGKTTPVNSFIPNALGLYDMSGNVWEWCADWYAADYYQISQIQGTSINPTGPEGGSSRVLRGGSWARNSQGCRSASRRNYVPSSRNHGIGFRLVLSISPV